MVLWDDVGQQLVLALGQLDEGADTVNVGVRLHVQHVVSPWGDGSVPEPLGRGHPLSSLRAEGGGVGLPSLWSMAPSSRERGSKPQGLCGPAWAGGEEES